MSNYPIWKYDSYPANCALKQISGLERTYRLYGGTPLLTAFPRGAASGIRFIELAAHAET
jgi:hypothetical protein